MDEKLEDMFKRQELFQKNQNADIKSIEYIRTMTLAAIDELMESLHETSWKPWKMQQKYDREAACDELIDAVHFIINLAMAHGMTAHEFYIKFIQKSEKNKKRAEQGY